MASGKWIGIELYEKNGKNDGSVDGVAYFKCELGYGVFVRPSQIRSLHGSELDALTSSVCTNGIFLHKICANALILETSTNYTLYGRPSTHSKHQ